MFSKTKRNLILLANEFSRAQTPQRVSRIDPFSNLSKLIKFFSQPLRYMYIRFQHSKHFSCHKIAQVPR